jgi:hypothetical protein
MYWTCRENIIGTTIAPPMLHEGVPQGGEYCEVNNMRHLQKLTRSPKRAADTTISEWFALFEELITSLAEFFDSKEK